MFFQGTTNPKKRFGKFVAFNDANIKPQTAVCTRDGFTGDDAAVITHSNPSDKPFSAHTFVWTPLPGDESEVMLTLRAVVVGQSNKQWMEVAPIAVKFS